MQQLALWSVEHMMELEEKALAPGAKQLPPPPRWDFTVPWLRGNGQVIVRVKKLGQSPQWVLAAPEHPAAEAYRVRLEWSWWLRAIDYDELSEFLRVAWEREQQRRRDEMLAEVMAEATAILSEGQVMAK